MSYQFLQAAHYHPGGNGAPTRIVVHREESPMRPGSAKATAQYFHTTARVASAHACVDDAEVWKCVHEADIAYHAPPNARSLGIEHSGYSADNDWATPFGRAMLDRSALLAAEWCDQFGIPAVWLSVADLKAGRHGITSHYNVSLAFGQTSHTDPGKFFPSDGYIAGVRAHQHHGGVAVAPRFNPPYHLADIADAADNPGGQGTWLLGVDGAIYNFEGAPGGNSALGGPHGRQYFAGRTAARFERDPSGALVLSQGVPAVIASTGERYAAPFDAAP